MSLPKLKAPIHKNRTTTLGRISGFYSTGSLFKSTNLSNKLYPKTQAVTELKHIPILGPHGSWKDYDFITDIKHGQWNDAQVGQSFGPTWTTHWFRVKIDVPSEWTGLEVHFRFSSGTEACIFDPDGNVIQGISPAFREEFILGKPWNGSLTQLEYYVEMACTRMLGAGDGDNANVDIGPPDNNKFWKLSNVDIAVFDRQIFELITDIEMLHGMADQLGDSHVGNQAMFVANEMINLYKVQNDIIGARQLATDFFAETGGSKSHTVYAMGHCHIDTAWLWPYDETIRKCARSFSSQLLLMEEYPETEIPGGFKFVCSSAQQFDWVKEYYPSLYGRIKEKIADENLCPLEEHGLKWTETFPGGEGFMRQYYYGQKFFQDEFGITCKEFWLPDTFGYSAQIPQMLAHVGINKFLTQKMSWSLVNKFPHHNFWWEGIDGTKVLVHFPPGNSYHMMATIAEVLNSQNNSQDKGRCNRCVYLYGYGDGGGGPTRQMIERLKRIQNVDGLPRVKFSDTNEFFADLEKESTRFSKWVGELYLELHNGTYTSQAKIKWYNRKGEFLFREVELLTAMAYANGKVTQVELDLDLLEIDKCWKNFLLNQFHDVLPGSCIEFVTQDAWLIYEELFASLYALRSKYHRILLGSATGKQVIYNSLPWETTSVVFMKPTTGAPPTGANVQQVALSAEEIENSGEGQFRVPNTFSAALVKLNPSGYTDFLPLAPSTPVTFISGSGNNFGTYTNGLITLEVQLSSSGDNLPIESLYFGGSERIAAFNDYSEIGVNPGMLYIYDDVPMFWDAWDVMDYHLETRRLPDFRDIQVEEIGNGSGPIIGGYKWSANFGDGSSIERYTIMRAESPMIEYYLIVDWKESHKFLKVEWPLDVHSREATFEIQYGHAKRPSHMNTSWDMAKFEVCGHKWMDMSQADKGVSIISDSKYGWHARDNHVQLSLLRSPKNPDANCDMHKHYIYYAVHPHKGTFQESNVIQKAYETNWMGSNNIPLLLTETDSTAVSSFVTSTHSAVIVEAIKVARTQPEIEMNTLCFRLYEAFGGNAKSRIRFQIPIRKVVESDGLEALGGKEITIDGDEITLDFKPFQIRTILVQF